MSLPPVQHLAKVSFRSNLGAKAKCGNSENTSDVETSKKLSHPRCVTVVPVVIDFDRLLKTKNTTTKQAIPGISNNDLLHGVANLYSTSLPEVTDDIIYPTLCEKWSKTLLLLRDESEVEQEIKASTEFSKTINSSCATNNLNNNTDGGHTESIFSDDDASDEEDCDEEEDDNFMKEIPEFLKKVEERQNLRKGFCDSQQERKETQSQNDVSASQIMGIENRLIASATFERSYEKPGQRVIQLTLIAVRKKYRHLGMGHFLVQQLHDSTITGGSDVIIVNADHNAVEFFERENFTDDVLLNSPYAHIGDVWFNCKRMCYLPQYMSYGNPLALTSDDALPPELGLKEMELEMALWREKSLQAYQTQAILVQRMRQEILTLRARASLQDDVIKKLRVELEAAKDTKVTKQEDHLRKRLNDLKVAMINLEKEAIVQDDDDFKSVESSSAQDMSSQSSCYQSTVKDEGVIERLVAETDDSSGCSAPSSSSERLAEKSFLRNVFTGDSNPLPHDHLTELTLKEITHCFVASMDSGEYTFSGTSYHVTNVISTLPARPSTDAVLKFEEVMTSCRFPEVVASLYFCGSQPPTSAEHLLAILTNGFTTDDFAQSDYGLGLHFSRHARAASRFSPSGKVLVARVCLGSVQTVTSKSRNRTECPEGFDSVLTPGRIATPVDRLSVGSTYCRSWNAAGYSEYVVFRPSQALPLALIDYNLIM